MITKNELNKYCSVIGFNLAQVEKDYLQHLFLIFLSQYFSNELIFKGGTAMQKIYGLNRFSIDLDFTQTKDFDISLISKIANSLTDFGYETKFEEVKNLGKNFIFKIKGPLYVNSLVSLCTLRLDISLRESILLDPKLIEIFPVYSDLRPYNILVMDEREIMAEKVRTIMNRSKPRDIFDFYFLLRKGVKFDISLINKKLKYYNQTYDSKSFLLKIKDMENLWSNELKDYVSIVPNFAVIFKEIKNII